METLLDWIAANPHWAGAGVFLVAFSESLAIVGLFMPGAFMMFGIGALIALDHLAFLPTMAWAVAGAICGDGVSFWIGHHFRQELRAVWPFRNYPRLINRGVDFFHRHGGKSIVFGRFVGPVRPIMPAVAGMLEMPVGRYLTINVLSGLVWAPAYLLPGMAFGASLELAAAVTARLALLLLLLAGLLWLTYGAARLLWRLGRVNARMAVLRLLDWGRHHPHFAALTAAVGDPGGPEARGLAVLAAALLAAAALGFGLLDLLFALPTGIDQTLHGLLVGLRNPHADRLMVAVTELGDGPFLAIYAALVAAGLMWHDRAAALHWLAALAFALVAPVLLKGLLQVPRPEPFAMQAFGSAFPSAHALRATVIYGFAAVLLARAAPAAWRWLPYTAAALLAITVALSRPYLGVHWPADVVAGLLVGGIWVVLLGTAFRVRATGPAAGGRLAAVLLLPLLLVTLLYVPLRLPSDLARYDPQIAARPLDPSRWRTDPWPELTLTSPEAVAAGGGPVLVWAARLDRVGGSLERAGWRVVAPSGATGWLRGLGPEVTLDDLPPLPQVRDGRAEALRLARPAADGSRLVMRLWNAHRTLDDGSGTPIWIGRVARERPAQLLGLFTYARGESAGDAAGTALAAVLASEWPLAIDGGRLRVGPRPH